MSQKLLVAALVHYCLFLELGVDKYLCWKGDRHGKSYFSIYKNVALKKKKSERRDADCNAVTTSVRQISARKLKLSNHWRFDEIFDEFEINIFCIKT